MPLNPNAKTVIQCIPLRTGLQTWYAVGDDRNEAEHYFGQAIMSGAVGIPAYRVVAQYKVDQFDAPKLGEVWH